MCRYYLLHSALVLVLCVWYVLTVHNIKRYLGVGGWKNCLFNQYAKFSNLKGLDVFCTGTKTIFDICTFAQNHCTWPRECHWLLTIFYSKTTCVLIGRSCVWLICVKRLEWDDPSVSTRVIVWQWRGHLANAGPTVLWVYLSSARGGKCSLSTNITTLTCLSLLNQDSGHSRRICQLWSWHAGLGEAILPTFSF